MSVHYIYASTFDFLNDNIHVYLRFNITIFFLKNLNVIF